MNSTKFFLKLSILIVVAGLVIASLFLYRFLYQNEDPLLQDQSIPIPVLDIQTYESIRSKYE